MDEEEVETPPPQPPKPLKMPQLPTAITPDIGEDNGEEVAPRLRITSLRRPTEPASGQDQPITAAGWPPGDHRLLPENCLNESNEVINSLFCKEKECQPICVLLHSSLLCPRRIWWLKSWMNTRNDKAGCSILSMMV